MRFKLISLKRDQYASFDCFPVGLPLKTSNAFGGGDMFSRLWASAILAVLATLVPAQPMWAQISVPTGARVDIGNGTVRGGGVDLAVAGQLLISAGQMLGLRHVGIANGGVIDAGDGLIRLVGDWRNDGSFLPGSSLVDFVDGAGLAEALVSGDSEFSQLSFVSTQGKRYQFMVDSEQQIAASLRIRGVSGNPIQFASTQPGQVARINLSSTGAQDIAHVGVSDVHATGQPLAPLLTNEGGSGNANGWFGVPLSGEVHPVPSLNLGSLALLALLIGFLARSALSRSQAFS